VNLRRLFTSALLIGLFPTCFAQRIVSWDFARGGNASLEFASNYSSTRSMISSNFPTMSLSSVSSITSAALENADIVWLGTASGNTSAISPLSAQEQQALASFIAGGGTAFLFADNDSFSPGAAVANTSLMAPVGATVSGTISGGVAHVITDTSGFPFSGPIGQVLSLSSGFPGWFTSLPSSAQILTTLSSNNAAMMANIPIGGLSQGSGRVWLFSDSGWQGSGGSQGESWNTLYANMLSASAVPEPGSIVILGLGIATLLRRNKKS